MTVLKIESKGTKNINNLVEYKASTKPSLPTFLVERKDEILNAKPQEIFMWTSSYDNFKRYKVVRELYEQFPGRNLQRKDVISVMKKNPYKGFVAAMMWGGINATRPKTKGGTDTDFKRLLSHPRHLVSDAIEYARGEIIAGNIVGLFTSFSFKGKHKLPGIGYAYFTKLFFFLGEIEQKKCPVRPLIWDKWTSNAHCALLIQVMKKGKVPPYLGIKSLKNRLIHLPNDGAQPSLYEQFLSQFGSWSGEIGVTPAKLEEFVFGYSLKVDKSESNPRVPLWRIIIKHFGSEAIHDSSLGHKRFSQKTVVEKVSKAPTGPHRSSSGGKYFNLQEYFRVQSVKQRTVTLSVAEIEKIIGKQLPNWAFTHKHNFWSNSGSSDHVQKRAWLSQGYAVRELEINEKNRGGKVKFVMRAQHKKEKAHEAL